MLERKPWKRQRKGKKIPKEKTDRDQSETLLHSFSSFQLQWTAATRNLGAGPQPQGRLPGRPAAGGAGEGHGSALFLFHTAASAATDARRARHSRADSRASLAWAMGPQTKISMGAIGHLGNRLGSF